MFEDCFFVYYLLIFLLFSIFAVIPIPYCIGVLIVTLLKPKWFRIAMTILLSLIALHLFIFNVVALTGRSYIGYETIVFPGIGVAFLSLVGTLIRIRSFGDRRYIWFLMIADLLLAYYPTYESWELAMGV